MPSDARQNKYRKIKHSSKILNFGALKPGFTEGTATLMDLRLVPYKKGQLKYHLLSIWIYSEIVL